jgi:DNA-binding NarL/FixJ family response regulator
VLTLVGKGLANGEIARELYISEVTVKAHLGRAGRARQDLSSISAG